MSGGSAAQARPGHADYPGRKVHCSTRQEPRQVRRGEWCSHRRWFEKTQSVRNDSLYFLCQTMLNLDHSGKPAI